MLVTTSLFPRGIGPVLNATWGCTVCQLISSLSSFLEVFVFFWGEGGRRLHQHDLQAGTFGVSWEGLQSWRQYGRWHLCWLLPVSFPEFLRCCGKKTTSPSLVMHLVKGGEKKKLQEKSLSMFLPKGTLPWVFPTGRSDLAQYSYCFYILLQIESYASEIGVCCSCSCLCFSGAYLLHARD